MFGRLRDPVVILDRGVDTGETTLRTQDSEHPAGDGVFFGRDYLAPGLWTFTVAARTRSALREFASAWRADHVRSRPGAVTRLDYNVDGTDMCVFGRPGNFAVEPTHAPDPPLFLATAQWRLSDAHSYGPERSLMLSLVDVDSGEGVVLPEELPWLLSPDTATREGVVVVDSDVGCPFRVHITGPLSGQASDFRVWSDGWEFHLNTYLSIFGNLIIDTATGTATRNSAVFGAASARTDWRARLTPGPQEVRFTANDPSGSSTCTIYWRDAATTI